MRLDAESNQTSIRWQVAAVYGLCWLHQQFRRRYGGYGFEMPGTETEGATRNSTHHESRTAQAHSAGVYRDRRQGFAAILWPTDSPAAEGGAQQHRLRCRLGLREADPAAYPDQLFRPQHYRRGERTRVARVRIYLDHRPPGRNVQLRRGPPLVWRPDRRAARHEADSGCHVSARRRSALFRRGREGGISGWQARASDCRNAAE